MSRENIITCLRVLHHLLIADQQYTDHERAFFERVITSMKLSDEARGRVETTFGDDAEMEAALQGLPFGLRRGQIEALMEGALVDGHVDHREYTLIKRVAGSLGLDDHAIDMLWTQTKRDALGSL